MTTTTNFPEHINKMYDSSLASQKEALQQNYDQSVSDLDAQQQKAQKQTDANLSRAYVEAAKSQKNYNEVQNAYGMTSGAAAQDNQLQSNLTTIRATQQETDAEAERQRGLLAKQYMSAIAKAQADNDLQRAQMLYQEAKDADADLLQKQKEAASLMAGAGDYSLYAALYGLTDEQLAKLQGKGKSSGGSGGGGDDPKKVVDGKPGYYDTVVNDLNKYVSNGASKSQISTYLRSAYGEGLITEAERNALREIYMPAGSTY